MKRLYLILVLIFCIPSVYAIEGELGYFGGISEGTRLPSTIESILGEEENDNPLVYKEVVFIDEEPIEFLGTIEIENDGDTSSGEAQGSYEEKYTINAENKAKSAVLAREITFVTKYRIVEDTNQIIKSSNVKDDSWSETITIGETVYTIDQGLSKFNKSILEDITPGVKYYSGSISARYVYETDTDMKELNVDGKIYGYDQPWSRTETQMLNIKVDNENFVTVKPSYTVKKILDYSQNDPYAISFEGNYKEFMKNTNSLTYTYDGKENSMSISSFNTFEQLIAPKNMEFMKGHWAESDVKKLFSMEILDEDPRFFRPQEATTRAEFAKALCLAMKLVDKYEEKKEDEPTVIAFSDVLDDHPYYKYIMAAYENNLMIGKGIYFEPEKPITREEAFVIFIRVIGLERLGLDIVPRTNYEDDKSISSWAKKSIYAATNLGLVQGNNGYVYPRNKISKAETSALINRLIDYLRNDIEKDYNQRMVNF